MEKDLINLLKERDMSSLLPTEELGEMGVDTLAQLEGDGLVFNNKFYSK